MMLVKAHVGNGVYELHEAHAGLRYTQPHCIVEIPRGYDHTTPGPTTSPPYFVEDRGFPYAERHHIHLGVEDQYLTGEQPDSYFAHWVWWLDEHERPHLLVADSSVFIMNERGVSVENLRRG